jgi:CheY-like chemotaxis protein
MDNLGRILMVEDDPKDVELTMMALEGHNLANEVVVTRDGEEALDYHYRRGKYSRRSSDHPAVILLDLKLPKIDGLGVLRQVKTDNSLKIIPVVVLTSSNEERDLVSSYKLGGTRMWLSRLIFTSLSTQSSSWASSGRSLMQLLQPARGSERAK